GSALQAKQISESAEIVTIAPVALTDAIANPPSNEFAYMVPNPLAQYGDVYCGAFEATGIESLAILSAATPGIAGILGTPNPLLRECVDIVATQSVPGDAADLTAPVTRLMDAQPDAVLVGSVGGHFELLAQNTLYRQQEDVERFSLASIGNQPESWSLAD